MRYRFRPEDDEMPVYEPPSVYKVLEERMPYEKQMEKLRSLLPPPQKPSRWKQLLTVLRG